MIPDHERHMTEVHSLAEAARDTQTPPSAPLGAQPASGVIAPIYMGKAHEVIPDRYILHYSTVLCNNCAAESHESKFYALSFIKSRVNGTRVRHLIPCDRPEFNLPVDRVPTGHHKTPFCAECEDISLTHLPPPPSESQLYDLAEPRIKGAAPRARPTQPPKATTLDDLI